MEHYLLEKFSVQSRDWNFLLAVTSLWFAISMDRICLPVILPVSAKFHIKSKHVSYQPCSTHTLCHNASAELAIFTGKQIHDTFQVPFDSSHEFVIFFFRF